jgi:hypothetical protein
LIQIFCKRTSSILQTRVSILSYENNFKKSMKILIFHMIFSIPRLIIPIVAFLPSFDGMGYRRKNQSKHSLRPQYRRHGVTFDLSN